MGRIGRLLVWCGFALLAVNVAAADEGDPPTRAARLAFMAGTVSFQPAGTGDWVAPYINRPLTTGDQLWCDSDGRAELQLDGSALRVSASTDVSFINLDDNVTQVQLSSGTVIVRVRRLNDQETYEIDTPNLAFSVLRPGLYRLSVDPSGNATAVIVRSGQGEVTGAGVAYAVYAGQNDLFSGTDQLAESTQPESAEDEFDTWSDGRDGRWDRSRSAGYLPPDVVGYDDLDDYGAWNTTPEYGTVWFPSGMAAGWAPYQSGHWAYVAPWGYTWVDDNPWGFAPFHYGRWVWLHGGWGWVPPPRAGPAYVPTVYAPALVAWVGIGAGVAWVALGPREVYVPSYPVSRTYVNDINISNTTVNTTVINNVYNTTIVNKTVTNVTYVNRSVPGAVVATSSRAFTTALPVARNKVNVDARTLANARVQPLAPAVVPDKQAVLGSQRTAARTPPAAVARRTVVARTAPPPPPPSFAKQQAAIRSNDGKPISLAQVRQISGGAASATAVRIAPPAHLLAAGAGARPAPHAPASPPAGVPPAANTSAGRAPSPPGAARPSAPRPEATSAARPVHPNEAPPPPRPASAATAENVLERQHLQEQQRMAAQQNVERQRLQQQQEAEHQRQLAAQAHQQLETQHQAQTAQLLQQHAQQQQALEERQAAETRRQNEPPARQPAKSAPKSAPPPPGKHPG
jgi:hypothetical protein